MKRFITFMLAGLLLLVCTTCSDGNESIATQTPTTTEATIAMPETMPVVTDPSYDYAGLFQRLEGYWNTEIEDDGYTLRWFVRFHYNAYNDAKPSLYCGAWDSECSDIGELIGGQSTGESTAELAFLFPAITEEGELPMHPELTAVVSVDFGGLDNGGEIAIKINNYSVIGNGTWHTYTYDDAATQAAKEYEATL